MSQTLELLLKARNETNAAFKDFQGEIEKTKATLGGLSAQASSVGQVLAGIGVGIGMTAANKALELFTGALAGVREASVESVKHLAAYADRMDDIRAKTGLSFRAQQEWAVGLKLTGTSVEAIAGSINKMQNNLVKGADGFAALGLNVKRLKDQAPEQTFENVAEKIRGLGTHAEKTAAAMAIFGKSGAQALGFIEFGAARSAEEAHHLGRVMSEETVQAAADLADEADRQGLAWEALRNNLASVITDNKDVQRAFHDLTEAIAAASRWVLDHKAHLGILVSEVVNAARAIGEILVTALRGAALAAEKFKVPIEWLINHLPGLGGVSEELKRISDRLARASEEARLFPNASISNTTPGSGGTRPGFSIGRSAEEAKKQAKEIADEAAREWKEHFKGLEQMQALGVDALHKLGQEASKAIGDRLFAQAKNQIEDLTKANKELLEIYKDRVKREQGIAEAWAEEQKRLDEERVDGYRNLSGVFGALLDVFAQLGGSAESAFGKIVAGLQAGTAAAAQFLEAENSIQKAQAVLGAAKGAIGKGFLGGAASGAAFGSAFGIGGAVVGAGVGGLLGLFGGDKEHMKVNDLRDQFVEAAGGLDKLRLKAFEAGLTLDHLLQAKNVKSYQAAVEELTAAWDRQAKEVEDHQKRLAGLGVAADGLSLRVKGFAASMDRSGLSVGQMNARLARYKQELENAGVSGDELTKKLADQRHEMERWRAATDADQASFDRLGRFAVATFAGLVRETGDAIAALEQMGDSLDELSKLQDQFGFATGTAFQRLLALRGIVQANQDIADSISGLNQMMQGLTEAGLGTAEMFNDFGADAASLFAQLTARGVDANSAMALMAPTLQQLWEHQQKFHDITDEATLALLRQAEQAGLVGEQQKAVNEQILDVLLAIATVLGADLPEALRRASSGFDNMAEAARRAAEQAGNVRGPSGGGEGVAAHARGWVSTGTVLPFIPRRAQRGLVTGSSPELFMAGDGGEPELIAPVRAILQEVGRSAARAAGGGAQTIHVHVEVDGREIGRVVTNLANRGGLRVDPDAVRSR